MSLKAGSLLISQPFLLDPNFSRVVVILVEHNSYGGFGFILNRLFSKKLHEVITLKNSISIPLYTGGPVEKDTIHFLHCRNDIIIGGINIINDLYWGGDFDQALELIAQKKLTLSQIRFFKGYAGWEKGQLEQEIKEKTWIIDQANSNNVFCKNVKNLWKDVLINLGGEYKLMANYPINPQLN